MNKTSKWTVKDVITTVLLTVLLILIQLVVNMVCMANDFVSMVLSVGFTMLLCAPVYFLMVSRVRKRFVSLVYMTILGIVFLIMGNWYLLPLWFFWDTYEAFAVSSGMEQSYIDSFIQYYSSPGWLVFIILFTTLCGFVGSLIGGRLINKHFRKAGVL